MVRNKKLYVQIDIPSRFKTPEFASLDLETRKQYDRFGFDKKNIMNPPIGLVASMLDYPAPGARDKFLRYIQIQSSHIEPAARRMHLLIKYRHKIDLVFSATSQQYVREGNIHAADALLS